MWNAKKTKTLTLPLVAAVVLCEWNVSNTSNSLGIHCWNVEKGHCSTLDHWVQKPSDIAETGAVQQPGTVKFFFSSSPLHPCFFFLAEIWRRLDVELSLPSTGKKSTLHHRVAVYHHEQRTSLIQHNPLFMSLYLIFQRDEVCREGDRAGKSRERGGSITEISKKSRRSSRRTDQINSLK